MIIEYLKLYFRYFTIGSGLISPVLLAFLVVLYLKSLEKKKLVEDGRKEFNELMKVSKQIAEDQRRAAEDQRKTAELHVTANPPGSPLH